MSESTEAGRQTEPEEVQQDTVVPKEAEVTTGTDAGVGSHGTVAKGLDQVSEDGAAYAGDVPTATKPTETPVEASTEIPEEAPIEAPTEVPSDVPTEAPPELVAEVEVPSLAAKEDMQVVEAEKLAVPSDAPTEAPPELVAEVEVPSLAAKEDMQVVEAEKLAAVAETIVTEAAPREEAEGEQDSKTATGTEVGSEAPIGAPTEAVSDAPTEAPPELVAEREIPPLAAEEDMQVVEAENLAAVAVAIIPEALPREEEEGEEDSKAAASVEVGSEAPAGAPAEVLSGCAN